MEAMYDSRTRAQRRADNIQDLKLMLRFVLPPLILLGILYLVHPPAFEGLLWTMAAAMSLAVLALVIFFTKEHIIRAVQWFVIDLILGTWHGFLDK